MRVQVGKWEEEGYLAILLTHPVPPGRWGPHRVYRGISDARGSNQTLAHGGNELHPSGFHFSFQLVD